MFSKITFLKSGDQAEKNEVCLSFLEEIFTKSVHRGGVGYMAPAGWKLTSRERIFIFKVLNDVKPRPE